MKQIILLLLCSIMAYSADLLLFQESFEGAAQYRAHRFSDGENYFTIYDNSQDLNHAFVGAHGDSFFVAEDVDEAINPLGVGEKAYIHFNSVDLSAFDSVRVVLSLAATDGEFPNDPEFERNQFGPEDSIRIAYAWDGDSAAHGDITGGTYTAMTSFRGAIDVENAIYSTPLIEDADLDGIQDESGLTLSGTFQDVILTIPVTGKLFSLQLLVDVDGYDDIAFDNIRIFGAPDKAPVEEVNSALTVDEGDSVLLLESNLRFSDELEDSLILYSLTKGFTQGTLTKGGVPVTTFTQADIDSSRLLYTHDGGESSVDSLFFTVSDGVVTSGEHIFPVSVTPVNDAPVLTAVTPQVIKQETPIVVTLAMTDGSDVDNTLSDANVVLGSGENYHVKGTTVTPLDGFVGALSVPVTITDGALNSETVAMVITVEPTVAIVELDGKASTLEAFAVAPNIITVEDAAHFVINEKLSGKGRIVVLDHLGDLIDEQLISIDGGGHFFWDLRNSSGITVTSGIYLVVLELDGKIYQKPIGIQR